MNLSIARAWIRRTARNANSSKVYVDADIDSALQTVGQRFCRNTKALVQTTSAALVADDTSFTLQYPSVDTGSPSLPDFMPEQLMSLVIESTGRPIEMVSAMELRRLSAGNARSSGKQYGAIFGNATSPSEVFVNLWPAIAVANDTVDVQFWLPFSQWAPGIQGAYSSSQQYYIGDVVTVAGTQYQAMVKNLNASPTGGGAASWMSLGVPTVGVPTAPTFTLNLPDSWLAQILPLGPPAMMQLHEPENAKGAAAKWAEYLAVETSFRNAGSLKVESGRKTMQR